MLYFRDFPPTVRGARGAACAGAGDNAGEMRTLGHWTQEAVPGPGNMAVSVSLLAPVTGSVAVLLLLRSVPHTTLLCVTFMETQDVNTDVIVKVMDVLDNIYLIESNMLLLWKPLCHYCSNLLRNSTFRVLLASKIFMDIFNV